MVGKSQRPRAEAAMDVPKLDRVGLVVHPLDRISDALGRIVGSGQNVLNAVLLSELVHRREKGMILRRVDVRHAGLEVGELQIAHLLPVDDFRVEIQTQLVDQLLDVVYRLLGIPAGIDMKDQRPQAEFCAARYVR